MISSGNSPITSLGGIYASISVSNIGNFSFKEIDRFVAALVFVKSIINIEIIATNKIIIDISIIILLVAIISIFIIDFTKTKAATNLSISLKEKLPILDTEIEAYIPPKEVIGELPEEINILDNYIDSKVNSYNYKEDNSSTNTSTSNNQDNLQPEQSQ